MGLKTSQYNAIMREYEQRQLKNHNIQTARYKEVYEKLPEFKELDDSISILSVQYGRKLLGGDEKAVDSLKEELAILRSSKRSLLVSAGFPEDYLEPIYDCKDCKDTGYIGNKKCHCFKKAIIKLLYEQSNIKGFPVEASFDNFRLDFYPANYYDRKTDALPALSWRIPSGSATNLSTHSGKTSGTSSSTAAWVWERPIFPHASPGKLWTENFLFFICLRHSFSILWRRTRLIRKISTQKI